MNEIQHNIDRLAEIIANYVRVNDIGFDALTALEPVVNQLRASESNWNFLNDSFSRAMKNTKKFV